MFDNYEKYLEFLNEHLAKFFENQKEYICCKKGCSLCCENGEYPYSKIEMDYLLEGLKKLDIKQQKQIKENIEEIIAKKKEYTGKTFVYKCPFLINNSCSVYEYRGVVCRAFGLIENASEGNPKIPFCAYQELNYSNVLDKEKKVLTTEKYKALNLKEEPVGFNISYKFLTDEAFEKKFQFQFGEKLPLINWFIVF